MRFVPVCKTCFEPHVVFGIRGMHCWDCGNDDIYEIFFPPNIDLKPIADADENYEGYSVSGVALAILANRVAYKIYLNGREVKEIPLSHLPKDLIEKAEMLVAKALQKP